MAVGIFWMLFLLMAAVDIDQLLLSFEKKGIFLEKRRDEILQRLKEQEASLQLLLSRVKKEIADLEARQEGLTRPELALDRKIQQYVCKTLLWVAIILFKLCK